MVVTLEHIIAVGNGGRDLNHRMQGREMLPTLGVRWQSLPLMVQEVGHFHKVAGMSIIAMGSSCFKVDSFNCRQPCGLNKLSS